MNVKASTYSSRGTPYCKPNDTAIAMGNYYFTSEQDKKNETKVEYTFGYIRDINGNLRINLHHSSIPHSGH